MDRPKVQNAANTSGVCAETESVKLFQLWTDEKKWIENGSSKSTEAANKYGVCAETESVKLFQLWTAKKLD
jgi:hypothetical protein